MSLPLASKICTFHFPARHPASALYQVLWGGKPLLCGLCSCPMAFILAWLGEPGRGLHSFHSFRTSSAPAAIRPPPHHLPHAWWHRLVALALVGATHLISSGLWEMVHKQCIPGLY